MPSSPTQTAVTRRTGETAGDSTAAPFDMARSLSQADFERLAKFIQESVGIKMPPHKKSMLELRLARRLRALRLSSFEEYCAYVFESDAGRFEVTALIDAVTTNKTDFFREPEHFDRLLEVAMPSLSHRNDQAGVAQEFTVWSAGCSSGEEPYSIAIALSEFAESRPEFRFQVMATDISSAMLDRAVTAVYPESRVAPVPAAMRRKYFLRSKDREREAVRVHPRLRAKVSFGGLNLLEPFRLSAKPDVIFCRNTLIYFERAVQIDILERMSDALSEGGYLFVGHSETLHGMGLPLRHVAPTMYQKA